MTNWGRPPLQSSARPMPLDYGAQQNTATIVSFFNAVYGWMAAGLGLTAVVAWWTASHIDVLKQITGGKFWILVVLELALVFTISAAATKLNAAVSTALFMLYSALNGLTLSFIFVVYTLPSITGAFAACTAMFVGMSLYGFITTRDLTGYGRILFGALIGLVVASVINLFWANSTLYWLVTYGGILLFIALTAYDTQKLRQIAYGVAGDATMSARLSVYGALVLYLDFINLFLMLLRLLGDRRR